MCSCVAPSLGVPGLALLSSPHMQRFDCMFVCVFWVLSCCHTLHPTAGCNYHRDRVHKKEKRKNQKNKNPHKIIIHSPYPYSSLKKKKNHPESPGKNHVTYPRKAVPVITGYGLSTSLQICVLSRNHVLRIRYIVNVFPIGITQDLTQHPADNHDDCR